MRILLWIVGLFAAAAALAQLASLNDGYALVVLPPYRAQLSLNFLILALLGSVLALYGLLRLIGSTLRLPGRVGLYRARRRHDRGETALRAALVNYFDGHYSEALRRAEAAYKNKEASGLSALIAARAAHGLRDEARYRHWLGQARTHDAELGSARALAQAELALERGDAAEAGQVLRELLDSHPRQIAALRLSLRAAEAGNDWETVIHLARQLTQHKAMTSTEVEPILRHAHLARLQAVRHDPAGLLACWQSLDSEAQRDPHILARAIPLLVASAQGDAARRVLESVLERHWDSELARLYGGVCGEDAPACIARAEGWLREHPRDANLLFALGELCFHARLWGKAEGYLEASSHAEPRLETHLALARLFEQLERGDEAQAHYRLAAGKVCQPLAAPRLSAITTPVATTG